MTGPNCAPTELDRPMIPDEIVYPTTIAYDTKLMQPGCVLIAAGMGADPAVSRAFHDDMWLLVPTDNMQRLPIPNRAFLEKLVDHTTRAWENKS